MEANIILLLFAHWVGDYLLQTNKIAANKARGVKWLTIHVALYGAVLFCFSIVVIKMPNIVYFVLINVALHWGTDFITSRAAAYFKDNPRVYFPILGFDQFIHATALILTFEYFK